MAGQVVPMQFLEVKLQRKQRRYSSLHSQQYAQLKLSQGQAEGHLLSLAVPLQCNATQGNLGLSPILPRPE